MIFEKRRAFPIALLWLVVHIFLSNQMIFCLDAPPIHIPGQGIALGTYVKMFRTQNIKAYLGLQYATAQRFSPPEVDGIKWNGILNATKVAPSCWQKSQKSRNKETEKIFRALHFNNNQDLRDEVFDEECLYLNVFIPDGSAGRFGYAVIVWLHGGDFSYGSPTDFHPFQLVFKQKVIVVTVAYRLNIFGFLSTGDGESQGNYGLMDQAAALFWVRKNIHHFGGDDKKITLMGHSAGAISVGLHLVSGEWSKNSFNRAIIMSGNPLSEGSVKHPRDYDENLDTVASAFGCTRRPTSILIQCLKRIDAKILNDNIPMLNWGPVVDYNLSNTSLPFLVDFPMNLFKKDMAYKVPTLIGITDMEDVFTFIDDGAQTDMTADDFTSYMQSIAQNDIKKGNPNSEYCNNLDIIQDALSYMYPYRSVPNFTYGSLITFHTDRIYNAPMHLLADFLSNEQEVFAYIFKTLPKSSSFKLSESIGVPKYFDQIFVWGAPYMENNEFMNNWNSSDKKISDFVMTLWANFVKTSNPTSSNVYIKWNSYNQNHEVLQINDDFGVENLSNNYKVQFWNNYYPRVLNFAAECCNNTNAGEIMYKNGFDQSYLCLLMVIFLFIHYVIIPQ